MAHAERLNAVETRGVVHAHEKSETRTVGFLNHGGTFVEHPQLVPTGTRRSTPYRKDANGDGKTDLLRVKRPGVSSMLINTMP